MNDDTLAEWRGVVEDLDDIVEDDGDTGSEMK